MKKVNISLNSFEKVKRFVNVTFHLNYEMNLVSGNYVVDGKSLLGIFNLDLSKPITMVMKEQDEIPEELEAFIV